MPIWHFELPWIEHNHHHHHDHNDRDSHEEFRDSTDVWHHEASGLGTGIGVYRHSKLSSFLDGPEASTIRSHHDSADAVIQLAPRHKSAVASIVSGSSHVLASAGVQHVRSEKLASALSFLSVDSKSISLVERLQSVPPLALVPLHAASVVACLPGHIAFELGEGYMFGFRKGFALAYSGKCLGAGIAFGVGRMALNIGGTCEWLQKQMDSWPAAGKIAKGVERGGAFSVALIRMAPVPCIIKNYSLPLLTDIPWTVYMPATMFGLMPPTAAHVYIGSLAPSAAELASSNGVAMHALMTASIVAGIGVVLSGITGYYLHEKYLSDDKVEEEVDGELVAELVEGLENSSRLK